MVSAALQPNLANVSTAFILCSALYILMVLLVLFWSRISAAAPVCSKFPQSVTFVCGSASLMTGSFSNAWVICIMSFIWPVLCSVSRAWSVRWCCVGLAPVKCYEHLTGFWPGRVLRFSRGMGRALAEVRYHGMPCLLAFESECVCCV